MAGAGQGAGAETVARAGASAVTRAEAARAWLRRVMPRVAVAASVVVVLRLLADDLGLARNRAVAWLLGVASLLVYLTIFYYGWKGLRWLKRRLLWRVRRRLVITYLFVGLTPIVLLLLLGVLTVLVGLNQVMTRVVRVHLAAEERQAQAAARALAETLVRQPQGASDARGAQVWLDERVRLLQASLPGARVAAWRGAEADGGAAFEGRPAQLSGEPAGEEVRGVGEDATPPGGPLPAWVASRAEWRGLSYVAPGEGETNGFGSPSLRALARARDGGREVLVLVTVPVSRASVARLRENTGVVVHPYFLGAEGTEIVVRPGWFGLNSASIGDPAAQRRDPENPFGTYIVRGDRVTRLDFRRDQLGEPVNTSSFVILPATNWATGEVSMRAAFMAEFSAWAVARQLFEDSGIGGVLQRAVAIFAVFFLVLELLALLSAAWMTRAVTVAVHRLHRATEYIKRGDFSHRVRVRSRDQLGELAEAFNEMSANIEGLLRERVERERLEREIEIAAEVQAQLFPREVPRVEGARVVGECRAARGVAGDYYDFVEVAPGLVAVALGDVSGKGIGAALVMSNLQAALRAQATILSERLKLVRRAASAAGAQAVTAAAGAVAAEPDGGGEMPCGVTGTDDACAVEQMAASINDQLCRSTDSNRFATVFLALYDARTRTLRYTNAGHNAPMLVRASGEVERLEAGGTVLGAFEWARYEEASVRLAAGDLVLIFSDGLTEARDASGEEFGDERLARLAASRRDLSAGELREAVFREIDAWAAGRERDDDQTVVLLKVDAE
jgi:phosphoserine phosphatase RsbU/P